MPITPAQSATFELPPEGKHNARLIWLAFLGTYDDIYEGKPVVRHRVRLTFELIGTQMTTGLPFVISKKFNVSPSKIEGKKGEFYSGTNGNLLKAVRAWSGQKTRKSITLNELAASLGSPVGIEIEINDYENDKGESRKSANIAKFFPCKDTNLPLATNPFINFAVGDELPSSLSFLADQLKTSWELASPQKLKEYMDAIVTEVPGKDLQSTLTSKFNDEDIPF